MVWGGPSLTSSYWIFRGTARPALVLSLLEIPLLAVFFFSYDNYDVRINDTTVVNLSFLVIALLAGCSFIVGFEAKDAGRAIKVFTLAQLVAFTASTVLFFIYPPILVERAVTAARGGSTFTQAVSGIEVFIVGLAILIVLFGIVLSGVGSFVGEWLDQKRSGASW